MADDILVDVIYAEPARAISKRYRLRAPATLADAQRAAASDADFAAVDVSGAATGVFGKQAPPSQLLCQGDRVELYRPLLADPKIARRARALRARRSNQ